MKILFASRLFQDVAGGVERMAIMLMNEMVARGHEVELLSWDFDGAETFYPINENIRWHKLNCGDARTRANWRTRTQRVMRARRILAEVRPDIAIAFQHGCFLFLSVAAQGLGIPIIAAERNAPDRFDHTSEGRNRALIFQSFRLADQITVQFDDYIGGYPDYLRSRIKCIGNPVPPAAKPARPAGSPGELKTLLSVGRLSFQKNHSVLIDAFAHIADRFPEWQLKLVGDGEEEPELRQVAEQSGVGARIEFAGAVKNVDSQYRAAHLFSLASRWEGFPNAIAEAMAHGLPCVAFKDCAGMPQLIESDVNGQLATGNGSPETLADALAALMRDDAERAEQGARARAAMEKHKPAQVFDQWEQLFDAARSRT